MTESKNISTSRSVDEFKLLIPSTRPRASSICDLEYSEPDTKWNGVISRGSATDPMTSESSKIAKEPLVRIRSSMLRQLQAIPFPPEGNTSNEDSTVILNAIRTSQFPIADSRLHQICNLGNSASRNDLMTEVILVAGLENPTYLLSVLEWIDLHRFQLPLFGVVCSAAERGYFSVDPKEDDLLARELLSNIDSGIAQMLFWDARSENFIAKLQLYHSDQNLDWTSMIKQALTILQQYSSIDFLMWGARMGSLSIVAGLIAGGIIPEASLLVEAKKYDRTEIVEYLEMMGISN